MRKLLPYQQKLAEALGVTDEEYAEFIDQQHIYADAKEGTDLDVRNGWAVVAIVLTVVGTLFQVASALLAPKPASQKQGASGDPVVKDQVLAPRFGFNGSQELAKYGDPVPLVYTNIDQNTRGGVRVKAGLTFSAVYSFGTHQLMSLMGIISASSVEIDPQRTALGQLPVKRLGSSSIWVYLGNGRAANSSDLLFGRADSNPITKGFQPYTPVARLHRYDGDFNGFSQTFAPTTSSTCGVTAVVPIKVKYLVLDNSGDRKLVPIPVSMYQGRVEHWSSDRSPITPGGIIAINIDKALSNINPESFADKALNDGILAAFAALDASASYKLGSALFEVITITPGYITDTSIDVTLRCLQTGRFPRCPYDLEHWRENNLVGLSKEEAVKQIFTKCLARVDLIEYTTVTKCNIVELAFRCQVWRRVSGRANVYGVDQNDFGDKASDNGLKARVCMAIVFFAIDGGPKQRIPYIFCFRGTSEQDIYGFISLSDLSATHNWEISIQPVVDVHSEISSWNCLGYCYINASDTVQQRDTDTPNIFFRWNGSYYSYDSIPTSRNNYPPLNDGPNETNEWDLFHTDAVTQYQLSFDRGPEINLTSVTEQLWGLDLSSPVRGYYDSLSTLAVHARSGAGIRDLRGMSAWVTKGKPVRPLGSPGTYSTTAAVDALAASSPSVATSYAPEIFLDSVLDKKDGIGSIASARCIDLNELAKSNLFVKANGLFMDALIADKRPWREFWSQVAPFSLLELARIGGRDTLVPAVPFDSNYRISRLITISGVFNPGNIIPDSYKEENLDVGSQTQDVILTVIYRDTELQGSFPRNNSVTVRLKDTIESLAVRETVDASQYVTRKEQAILLGQYLCNVRRHVRKGAEFKTFPTDTPIFPGAYVLLDNGKNEWQQVYSGTIEPNGRLNAPIINRTTGASIPDGTYTALLYKSGGNAIRVSLTVIGGFVSNGSTYAGYLFVLGNTANTKRVFRVTDVEMDEEGEVTVKCSSYPCDFSGTQLLSRISDFSSGLFQIQ